MRYTLPALMLLATWCHGADLREYVESGRLADLRWPDFSDYRAEVAAFYETTDYELAWTRAGAPTSQAAALVAMLAKADDKGLDSEDYDGARWPARVAALRIAHGPDDVTRFDLALTVSVLRYASDLSIGKWNPGVYCTATDLHRERARLAGLINQAARSQDAGASLSSLEPPFRGYWRAQEALRRYLVLARQDDGELLPATKKPVEPGMDYPGVPRLARLLRRVGDLPQDAPQPDKYTGSLVDAVKRFQERHGLLSDGRIGKDTLAELNQPLSQRVRQLQFSLERWRWVPHEFSRPPIVVNIPAFELRALNDDYSSGLGMKVVLGRAYGHQTPAFSAELNEVIFRPYWNVPASITHAELIPKIVKDRMYLAKNEYEVVTLQDRVFAQGAVDDATLAGLRAGTLAIRQRPGPKNSLGLVTFRFPNEHDVYLHDTPAPELFHQSRRDFSHGCIRVEKPVELALWVLRGVDDWTLEKIRAAMDGDKTLSVRLDRPIPVLIVYETAVVREDGEVRFFDDIYGLDAKLEELRAKGYPCGNADATTGEPARRPRE